MQTYKNTKLRNVNETIRDNSDSKTTLLSRNITVNNHRTSVRLEPEMWNSLYDIAKRERCKIHDICTLINLRKNPKTSLTAAIRVFLCYITAPLQPKMGMKGQGMVIFNT